MLTREQQDIIENSIWVVNAALKKQGLQCDKDLKQSAILYMCRCLERFDPSKNIKWTTFAYKNVYLFIKRTHKKEVEKNSMFVGMDIFDILEPIAEEQQLECAGRIIEKMKNICTRDEFIILEYKQKGYKAREIAQILNCSLSKINGSVQSIREKARGVDCEDLYR